MDQDLRDILVIDKKHPLLTSGAVSLKNAPLMLAYSTPRILSTPHQARAPRLDSC